MILIQQETLNICNGMVTFVKVLQVILTNVGFKILFNRASNLIQQRKIKSYICMEY